MHLPAHFNEQLEGNGISMGDIKKLKAEGIILLRAWRTRQKKALLTVKGISEAKADRVSQEAARLVPMGFTTASEFIVGDLNLSVLPRDPSN